MRVRVRVERGEVSRRMFGKSTTGRRVCTRQAAAAEEPLKSKQTSRELYPRYLTDGNLSGPFSAIQLPITSYCYCGAAVGKRVAGAGAERRKQGTREHVVDALGPSAPTPAESRHNHSQWMPPLAQRSLLRVLSLAQVRWPHQAELAATLSICVSPIEDRLRRGEIVQTAAHPCACSA